MLGQWEEAAGDLHVASKLDYDEEIGLVLKKVAFLCLLWGMQAIVFILYTFLSTG